jgi:hypothetical protein
MLSRAAKVERTGIDDLREADRLLSNAIAKLRSDSTGIIITGKLLAASLIMEESRMQIDARTTEV